MKPKKGQSVEISVDSLVFGGDGIGQMDGFKIFVEGARQEDLLTFLNALRRIGGEYEVADNGISFWRERPLTGIEFETDMHPGFMTDWHQPFVALLTQARGVSVVHETIYEDRFAYVRDLNAMGANIKVFSRND